MRADTSRTMFFNFLKATIVAFLLSLAIPDVEAGRIVMAIVGVIVFVHLDLRDRAVQLFDIVRQIPRRPKEEKRAEKVSMMFEDMESRNDFDLKDFRSGCSD